MTIEQNLQLAYDSSVELGKTCGRVDPDKVDIDLVDLAIREALYAVSYLRRIRRAVVMSKK